MTNDAPYSAGQTSTVRSSAQSTVCAAIPLDLLFVADAHPCPYLAGRQAMEEVFLAFEFSPELYHDFMDCGFRRSGDLFYRPICENCTECRSLRVPISDFQTSKSQRRVLRKNHDLVVTAREPRFTDEKFRIFSDYSQFQHHSDQEDSAERFRNHLYASPVMTLEFEYRLDDRLVAVSIADVCSRSLSSVYAYYDPEFSERSLGTFSALWEILFCRSRGIPYYYIGFYIRDCPAMNYKARFRQHEILSPEYEWIKGNS
jgi:arginyl-tRNA--protein-N-Asp/Glu arginylyltransferase